MRKSIWDEMREMQKRMDSVFRDFFEKQSSSLLPEGEAENRDLISQDYATPASDLFETENEVVAEIDIPGVEKDDIEVSISEDSVKIKAEKSEEKEEEKQGVYRQERSFSGFYREFPLSKQVDPDNAEAEYQEGVLKIKLPKVEKDEEEIKKIEVN